MMTPMKARPHLANGRAWLALLFGAGAYLIFLGVTVYSIGFVGGFGVPKTIDSGAMGSPILAVAVDVALLGIFAIQHSVMARPAFKRWWSRFVPRPVERSVYVLSSSLALALLYWQWRPIPATVWAFSDPIWRILALTIYGVGWLIVLASSFLIDHSDVFGLRQVYSFWHGRESATPSFKTPSLYRLTRHPMMVGFFVAFWATPHMTAGHALFAVAATGYIVAGVQLEERDLLTTFGGAYRRYQRQVRMFLPLPRRWTTGG